MPRVVVELTNRCNLRCQHCFDERHAGSGDLPMQVFEKVLREAKQCGVDHISFTGGEPTLHRNFAQFVRQTSAAGYTFSFVSNGSTLPHIYPLLVEQRRWFHGVTFSLDGAHESTHDRLRGRGSFRQVLRAASICVIKDLSFTFNMVITSQNKHEIAEMVDFAAAIGSHGVRFGHLMPGAGLALGKLGLSIHERREVETRIRDLRRKSLIPVGMAPGYFHSSPFFKCGPLEMEEFNLDYRGHMTLCCQLSGSSGQTTGPDFIGSLHDMSFAEAVRRFANRVRTYLDDKRMQIRQGEFGEADYFPCLYCMKYLGKPTRASIQAAGKHQTNAVFS